MYKWFNTVAEELDSSESQDIISYNTYLATFIKLLAIR